MTPAKPNDMNDTQVRKKNFATHLMWLLEICLISCSVLWYYERIFNDVIDKGRIRCERLVLRILRGFVIFWFLSSVIHSSFATSFSVNGR